MSIAAYQTVDTTTADPRRIVLMLFDGAIRFLGQAQRALERGDTAGFARWQAKAHAIVGELAASLNDEVGGEPAANLRRLYDFLLLYLAEGLVKRSPAHMTRAQSILRTVREGFQGAIEGPHGA
jgi:flagellar secretion chaperone FliS